MIELRTPAGLPVRVPESDEEDDSPKFRPDELAACRAFYKQHGYAVVRGLYAPATCATMRQHWDTEIKPYRGAIYRQATARAERHRFNEQRWVMNAVMNLQSVDPRRFPRFRRFATHDILCAPALADAFRNLLGEAPKLVSSMYFEGNSVTWEHQDCYYLDSAQQGRMCGAWIALETIEAQAGRFFICPGSHRLQLQEHGLANSIAGRHEVYVASVVQAMQDAGLTIRAPRLQQGDVLFWNSRTIHGSLDTQSPLTARSSITCHAIPASHDLLQFQTRRLRLPSTPVNGVELFCPKDQAQWRHRMVLSIESRFPKTFYSVKKWAIRRALAGKGKQSADAGH